MRVLYAWQFCPAGGRNGVDVCTATARGCVEYNGVFVGRACRYRYSHLHEALPACNCTRTMLSHIALQHCSLVYGEFNEFCPSDVIAGYAACIATAFGWIGRMALASTGLLRAL